MQITKAEEEKNKASQQAAAEANENAGTAGTVEETTAPAEGTTTTQPVSTETTVQP